MRWSSLDCPVRASGLLSSFRMPGIWHLHTDFPFAFFPVFIYNHLVEKRRKRKCFSQGGYGMTFEELYQHAYSVLNPRKLSEDAEAGGVGAALLTDKGNVYVGVCIDTACSMGFCAEHAAAAAMVTAGESRVEKMIAVGWDGHIMPPCGRCREFISQLNDGNVNTRVMVRKDVVWTLGNLLPYGWRRTEEETASAHDDGDQ